MTRIEKLSWAMVLIAMSDPAFAVPAAATPAPVVGIGAGALAVIGMGYRALKRHLNR